LGGEPARDTSFDADALPIVEGLPVRERDISLRIFEYFQGVNRRASRVCALPPAPPFPPRLISESSGSQGVPPSALLLSPPTRPRAAALRRSGRISGTVPVFGGHYFLNMEKSMRGGEPTRDIVSASLLTSFLIHEERFGERGVREHGHEEPSIYI